MLTEEPKTRSEKAWESALYTEYRQNPETFIAALVRQMEIGAGPLMQRPLEEADREEMHRIAKDMCFNGYWRFAGGLFFLIQCCQTNFLARMGIRIE